jgi:hypothetical protein
MTPTQKRFFSKPRTMAEILNDLFKGDEWAANAFQNENLSNGTLETLLIDNPLGKQYSKIIAIGLRKAETN